MSETVPICLEVKNTFIMIRTMFLDLYLPIVPITRIDKITI